MTVNDLKPFCCTDTTRPNLCQPWNGEGFTQATCGISLIRVAPIDGVPANNEAPITARLFPATEPVEWHEVAGLRLVESEVCPLCKGQTGTIKCYECGGDGEIDLDTSYNTYTVDCKTCDGDGEIRCEHCNGTGVVDGVNVVGSAKFSTELLRRLLPLPNCKLGITNDCAPAWFRFDGGDGLIMPIW